MTTAPLRCGSAVFLHIQDGLLAKEDKELPLARHVVGTLQHFHLIEDFVFVVFMRTKEVIVSNPESQVIVGAVNVVETVCVTVRSFVGAVEPFNHLFERTVSCRDSIVVGKSNHLGDFEGKVFPELFYEFHCGERIGTVAVSDELKVFGQFCKPPKSHAHGEDARPHTAVIGYLIADDGSGRGVHDQPDIGFNATDFYVGLVGSEHLPFFIRVLVNKGFDADSGGLTVVGDLLVGDADVIEVFKSLGGLAQRKAEVDMECQAKGHDMGVVLTEFQGRGVLWQGV